MTVRETTVADFCAQVGGTEPVPAGVSISAVSASLALALLAKVLDITSRRKDFKGDRERMEALIAAVRTESKSLTELADLDICAFNEYMASMRGASKQEALRKCIDVPMQGARAILRGLDFCAEATAMLRGLTAADLGTATAILHGAIRSMLISVDFNLLYLDAAVPFLDKIRTERRELEFEADRLDDLITTAIRALLL